VEVDRWLAAVAAAAPPLTSEQIETIGLIFNPGMRESTTPPAIRERRVPPQTEGAGTHLHVLAAPQTAKPDRQRTETLAVEQSSGKTSGLISAGRLQQRSQMDFPVHLRAYSLEEVAEITGLPLRRIQQDCRRKRVDHIRHGRRRGMTADQIKSMLTAYTIVAERVAELDDMELARQATLKSGARYRTRGRAG